MMNSENVFSPHTQRHNLPEHAPHVVFAAFQNGWLHACSEKQKGSLSFIISLTCCFPFQTSAVGVRSISEPNLLVCWVVFFCPKDYKIHFWLEETPTQLLNRLDFSKIINAPTSIFLFLFSAIFIYRTHTLDKYTFSALYGKYIADVLFLFIIGIKRLVSNPWFFIYGYFICCWNVTENSSWPNSWSNCSVEYEPEVAERNEEASK